MKLPPEMEEFLFSRGRAEFVRVQTTPEAEKIFVLGESYFRLVIARQPPETEEFSISGGWPEFVPVEATPPDGRFFVFGGLSTVKISDKGGAALYHGRNYCFLLSA